MKALRLALFLFGYPTAVAVITRWIPVVRERRTRWFLVHTAGVSAIVAGWALDRRWPAVAINGSWLVSSVVWYRPWAKDRP